MLTPTDSTSPDNLKNVPNHSVPDTSYGRRFFAGQRDQSLASARALVPLIIDLLHPGSVLDVGCGLGTWLSIFQEQGVNDVIGVDGGYVDHAALCISPDLFLAHDLVAPLDLKRNFDLVLSLEVAEHLPEPSAETFIDSLVRHGDVVLFSAAIPGQIGTNHINEQWPSYWATKFSERSFELLDVIRPTVWRESGIALCYKQNVLLFIRSSSLAHGELCQSLQAPNSILDIVHPDHYLHVQTLTAMIGRILSVHPKLYGLAERALIASRRMKRQP